MTLVSEKSREAQLAELGLQQQDIRDAVKWARESPVVKAIRKK
jgi:hypothetical protein